VKESTEKISTVLLARRSWRLVAVIQPGGKLVELLYMASALTGSFVEGKTETVVAGRTEEERRG
jgi:hypothetical protein